MYLKFVDPKIEKFRDFRFFVIRSIAAFHTRGTGTSAIDCGGKI